MEKQALPKLAIFDFDDTLAFHKDQFYATRWQSDKQAYYIQAYQNPDTFYEEIEPCEAPIHIREVVASLRRNGVTIFCVSAMKHSLHRKAKESFIAKHYGEDIRLISAVDKMDAIRMLARAYDVRLSEVLFVDDYPSNLHEAAKYGIIAFDPKDVAEIGRLLFPVEQNCP